jgi:hypothetical protein
LHDDFVQKTANILKNGSQRIENIRLDAIGYWFFIGLGFFQYIGNAKGKLMALAVFAAIGKWAVKAITGILTTDAILRSWIVGYRNVTERNGQFRITGCCGGVGLAL